MNLPTRVRLLFKEPYPYYFEGRVLLWLIGILFVMAVSFEVAFRPFEVYSPEHRMPHFWIAVVHSSVGAISLLLCAGLMAAFPSCRERWTVGKDIAFLSSFLLLTGIGQFLVRDFIYDNPNNWSWGYLFEEIRNTLLTGFLFILIIVPLNQARLSRKNREKARTIYLKHLLRTEASPIPIRTQQKNDVFDLHMNDFLFARAEGNYVAIYLRENEGSKRLLKRLRLSDLEQQLSVAASICRCHRSYLVNLAAVKDIQGNAQGYRLTIDHSEETVPVSRGMAAEFEARMQQQG